MTGDATMLDLTNHIRLKLQIDPNKSLFFIVGGNQMEVLTTTMEELYQKYKDEDGYLYINYYVESVFG